MFYSCEKAISRSNMVLPIEKSASLLLPSYDTLSNFRSIICQVVTYRRLQTEENSSLAHAVIRNGAALLFLKENPIMRNSNISSFKGEQKEAAPLVESQCNFANWPWGKSHISNLCNGKRNVNVQILKQIEEIKELRIPFIILSTKGNVRRLLFGEVKYKLVFGRQQGTFWMQNAKTCYIEWRFSAEQLCPIPCNWRVPHNMTPSALILRK